jgi:hypothetical protein
MIRDPDVSTWRYFLIFQHSIALARLVLRRKGYGKHGISNCGVVHGGFGFDFPLDLAGVRLDIASLGGNLHRRVDTKHIAAYFASLKYVPAM